MPTPPRPILIVEDETIVARDLQGQLELLGYTVAGLAHTGEQAIVLAAQLQPELVLMDIQLGTGIDGIAAALAIRTQRDVPVVFLSAFAADEVLQRAQLAEPYGYILKPFSERELQTVLKMAFFKQQAQQRERDLIHSNQAMLDTLTFYDELTGLPNRRCLVDKLAQAVAAKAQSGQHGALIFLDLDHFRLINDTLGPGFGDQLLRAVAHRLNQCVREEDTVAHLGGDEFMVMLDTLGTDKALAANRAEAVADKICHALSQPYSLSGHAHRSSASVGIVMFDQYGANTDELLKMADAAMYQAKSAGRNAVRFFDPAMQAQMQARNALESDLQRGLQVQEFVLHYQLQVNTQGEPLGVEALVRWQHPTRGLVSPVEFIALAEETGLILTLGQWVLDTACQQLVQWAQQPQQARWVMAVNVSALQFAQDDFVQGVAQAINLSGANPTRLKLELTESMLLNNVEEVISKMHQLKTMGVSFSLDDFGTGYSSLAYLKRLPLDQLKIDQSFVRDLLTDPDDATLCQTIVSLGHNLGMHVIAEGVETEGHRAALAAMDCDAFQGYLFARPQPADKLLKVTDQMNE
ncbi:MAG: hypothetical protein AUJ20_07965 [Comamonadaceae bacterium CG1_02_60_18]|nr:MAG: hypothetical protein AUJ20_07965 [Comamonadaceae bacterium CG1_02_60_18]PIQ51264.1 MAG: hypothetical protein COW02_15265 [Comamonadaceae bacterium CG12_big_fil_rev_8_21_14_0_65_59_15]